MRIKLFSDTWKGMVKTSSFLLFSNVVLSIAVIVMAVKVVNKEQIVTLVPPTLTKEATVGLRTANADYLMSFGMYVASLTGNITPKNVQLVADALGSLVDAKLYTAVRRQLFALANDPVFKNRGGSIYFEPLDVFYDAPTGKVFVKGNQVSLTSSGRQNRVPFIYEIQVEIRDRMPVIVSLDKYPGRQPHTLEWERKHERQAQRIRESKKENEVDVTPWFVDKIRYGGEEEEEGDTADEGVGSEEQAEPVSGEDKSDTPLTQGYEQ